MEKVEMLEQHLLLGDKKIKDLYPIVLNKIFVFPVSDIEIEFEDRPNEFYGTINDRTQKILYSLNKPEKITKMTGVFNDGGLFTLKGSNLYVDMPETEYNYELLDSMKNFLCSAFPLWLFKNQYIWGATIYEDYEKQHFYTESGYTERSLNLDKPELDIFQRDNGIISKYRFFTQKEYDSTEEAFKDISSVFKSHRESLSKRNYEGLEVFRLYCADKAAFRRSDPHTKPAKIMKALLAMNK